MEEIDKKRALLQLKRYELAVDEGELRILDLEAEIEKQKAKNQETKIALAEKKAEIDGLLNED